MHKFTGPVISLACLNDLNEILRIERDAYSCPWTEAQFLSELESPRSKVLVLRDDLNQNAVLGYAVIQDLFDETYLLNFAVARGFRREGLGRVLLGRVITDSEYQGHHRVFLDVREANISAISFYETHGFQRIGLRKSFYQDGESAFMMERRSKITYLC